jgi:hypothetical protein
MSSNKPSLRVRAALISAAVLCFVLLLWQVATMQGAQTQLP